MEDISNELSTALQSGVFKDIQDALSPFEADCFTLPTGEPLLLYAAKKGQTELVRAILTAPTFPSDSIDAIKPKSFVTPLFIASQRGYVEIVKLLLDYGADANIKCLAGGKGPNSFGIACQNNHHDCILLLWETIKGSKDDVVNACGRIGRAALHNACRSGDESLWAVKFLISKGADVNMAERTGATPAHHAVTQGGNRVLEELIRADPNVVHYVKKGKTMLHYAAKLDKMEIVKILLKAGVDPNILDSDGDSCLTLASRGANTGMCMLLCKVVDRSVPAHTYAIRPIVNSFWDKYNPTIGVKPTVPWRFGDNVMYGRGWDTHYSSESVSMTDYRTLELIPARENEHILSLDKERKHVRELVDLLGGERYEIKKAYAVDNTTLLSQFESFGGILRDRQKKLPQLWKKTSWKETHTKKREWVNSRFEDVRKEKGCTTQDGISAVLMVHGTTGAVAEEICSSGFGVVAALDPGWYGQGIYFTSHIKYSCMYSKEPVKVIIISYGIPGNIFPVVENPFGNESLQGSSIKPGYQSHFAVVKKGLPISENTNGNVYDEFVLAQDAQVLPKYVVFLKESKKKDKSNGKKKNKKRKKEKKEQKIDDEEDSDSDLLEDEDTESFIKNRNMWQ